LPSDPPSAFGRPTEAAIFPPLASGLNFGLRFGCLLGFALAFIFASHGTKYYTNGLAKRDAARQEKEKTMIHKHPAGAFTLTNDTTPGLKIGRDQILAKYWELANLDPQDTKGSITGQLNALEVLLNELRSTSAKESTKPLPAKQIYRSAWMDGKPRVN
jgi:hypothetical protein